jgi:hypothetical protein
VQRKEEERTADLQLGLFRPEDFQNYGNTVPALRKAPPLKG